MCRVVPLLTLALLAAGCSFEVDYDGTHFACTDNACPVGFECRNGLCERPGGDPADAAPADAPEAQPDAAADAAPGAPDATPDPPDAMVPLPDAMGPCLLSEVHDDFTDPARAPIWLFFADPPTTIAEVGGRLRLTLASNLAGNLYAGYLSGYMDARAQRITVALVTAPSAATDGQAFMKLEGPGGFVDAAYFEVEGGSLNVVATGPGGTTSTSLPYSSANHRFLSMREDAGKVIFETSSNGSAWTLRLTANVPIPFDQVRLVLGGGTYKAEQNPGIVEWDDVNGGGAPAGCLP